MSGLSKIIQNVMIAFIMATSVTSLYNKIQIEWIHVQLFNIPIFFLALFILCLFIASDVRNSFKKVLWYEKRKDKLPIWQVGIGMLFYFTQVGFVETFARNLMNASLDGMPLYLIISFLNAFLITVIYQEIFYVERKQLSSSSQSDHSSK